MTNTNYPRHKTSNGHMTEKIRSAYIESAISKKLLPDNAHRMAHVITLEASNDINRPIQFWQLYSVLGQDQIVDLVDRFYQHVYADEEWFTSVFSGIASLRHHVNSQASMWIDAMGGGMAYQGGEFRLNFHHSHNAMQLMNDKGAQRWAELMLKTLDESVDAALVESTNPLVNDPRVRVSINTFLSYFFSKYAEQFNFIDSAMFGPTNPPLKRTINFLNMSSDAIEALEDNELQDALIARGIDVSQFNKQQMINKAMSL